MPRCIGKGRTEASGKGFCGPGYSGKIRLRTENRTDLLYGICFPVLAVRRGVPATDRSALGARCSATHLFVEQIPRKRVSCLLAK